LRIAEQRGDRIGDGRGQERREEDRIQKIFGGL